MTHRSFSITRCAMDGVEAVAADTAHAFGRHVHDQFGIGVILRGAQTSASGRGVVEAEAGDVITVNPGEVHDGPPRGDAGRTWRMLYFDPDALAEPVRELTEGDAGSVELAYPALKDPALAACVRRLFADLSAPDGADSEISAGENLLLILGRLAGLRPPPGRTLSPPPGVERARMRIDDDPSARLALAELAAIAGLSQFQLVRGFARATGLTPHAYLVQKRLLAARRMIADGMALADTAQASGFADQSHMSRLFVRAYGVSPGLYAAAMA